MRWPRMSLRRWMAVVAVVAMGLAALTDSGAPQPVAATSSDPDVATRQQTLLHGVLWGMSCPQAQERARHEGKPLLIYFTGVNDSNSRWMERRVLARADVVSRLSRFVTVRLDIDFAPIRSSNPRQRDQVAEQNAVLQLQLVQSCNTPELVVTDARGHVIARTTGVWRPSKLIAFLDAAHAVFRRRSGPTWQDRCLAGLLVAGPSLIGMGVSLWSRGAETG